MFKYLNRNWMFCHHCYHVDILKTTRKRRILESRIQLWKFFLRLRSWFDTAAVPEDLLHVLNIPGHVDDPRRTLIFKQFLGYCPCLDLLRETCHDLRIPLRGARTVCWKRPGLVLPVHLLPGRLSGFLVVESQGGTLLSFNPLEQIPKGYVMLRTSADNRTTTWPDVMSMCDAAYLAAMRHPHHTLRCLPVYQNSRNDFYLLRHRLHPEAFCLKPVETRSSLAMRFDYRPVPLKFLPTTST